MLASLAVVFLAGLLLAVACARIGLPRIVGMLAAGILVGPFVCNLLDQSLLDISAALREMALIVILIRAGLALDAADLRRVGRPAVLMSFLPALCETAGVVLLALVFRSAGVLLCLVRTPLNGRERAFCVISYLPKATVQAAIGAVPLSLGLPCGRLVLSTAVLSILITAPLGAIGMDASYRKLLQRAPQSI